MLDGWVGVVLLDLGRQFVLGKALSVGLRPIVVINKVNVFLIQSWKCGDGSHVLTGGFAQPHGA